MEEWLVPLKDLGFWLVGIYAVSESLKKLLSNVEFFDNWWKKCGIKTKKMIERENERERLKNVENAILEIKDTAKKNVDMFLEHEKQVVSEVMDIKNEIVSELNKLHDKIDEQQNRIEKIDKDGKKRDCAVLRDRILAGMRYFSQNRDAEGNVHITLSDFENMKAMFDEYFKAGGNGVIKIIYDEEFFCFFPIQHLPICLL